MTDEELLQALIESAEKNPDDSALQLAVEDMMSAASPEELSEKLRVHAQDYKGRRSALEDDQVIGKSLYDTESPEGRQAGNNQFSVYVAANPLEHLAAGANKFMGGKQMADAREGLEGLSTDFETGLQGVQEAALAGALRGGGQGQGEQKPFDMTDEEWERQKRLSGRGLMRT
jgi:hypothetical protein